MKIKTSELEGAALDWAVAAVTGEHDDGDHAAMEIGMGRYAPSSEWSQGGPLIDRYRIDFAHHLGGRVAAKCMDAMRTGGTAMGENHLIAAMRAIVAAELGDVVDVPERLVVTAEEEG